jgi:hypothetical protein
MNKVYAKYFEDNGIGVVAMEGMGVELKNVPPDETWVLIESRISSSRM